MDLQPDSTDCGDLANKPANTEINENANITCLQSVNQIALTTDITGFAINNNCRTIDNNCIATTAVNGGDSSNLNNCNKNNINNIVANNYNSNSCANENLQEEDEDKTLSGSGGNSNGFYGDMDSLSSTSTDDDLLGTGELDESETELDPESEDPASELGQWLGQLQALTKELDGVRPNMVNSPSHQQRSSGASSPAPLVPPGMASPRIPPKPSGLAGGKALPPPPPGAGDPGQAKPRQKPALPPKPKMDTYRYSMVNLQESPDVDLDALLGELCELESQLNSTVANDGWMKQLGSPSRAGGSNAKGLPPSNKTTGLPPTTANSISATPASSRTRPSNLPKPMVAPKTVAFAPLPNDGDGASIDKLDNINANINDTLGQTGSGVGSPSLTPLGPQQSRGTMPSPGSSMPVGVNKALHSNSHSPSAMTNGAIGRERGGRIGQPYSGLESGGGALLGIAGNGGAEDGHRYLDPNHRAHSPDNDSAFCDSSSMLSSEEAHSGSHRSRDSNGSSAESSRASLTTPSPTQLLDSVQSQIKRVQEEVQMQENLTEAERQEKVKAEKIKLALEKMKEASIKKIYVKVFTEDGGSRSLLVDERWTVATILRQLAEKNRMELGPSHAIVEQYPDLYMERIYEDHEHLVENILMWTRDSANKLVFLERGDKFNFILNPQEYLLTDTSADRSADLDEARRLQLVEEFFAPSHVQPPELEGALWLKSDGKKTWKKHHCVLRASGLYYIPKGKSKSSKDLVCLMQLEMIQVYVGFGWKKKYKAPTDFGFALKHPQIQVKASKYIKYLCCEDERTMVKWMVGLRIAKHGRQLYENYESIRLFLESEDGAAFLQSIRNNQSAAITPTTDQSELVNMNGEAGIGVVMRPKLVAINGQAVKPNGFLGADRNSLGETSINLRPASQLSSVGGSNGPKRGSRTALNVEVPSVPNSPRLDSNNASNRRISGGGIGGRNVSFATAASPLLATPASSLAGAANCSSDSGYSPHDSYLSNGSGSETPTPDSFGSANGSAHGGSFESEFFPTNTIKRRPPHYNQQQPHGGVSTPISGNIPPLINGFDYNNKSSKSIQPAKPPYIPGGLVASPSHHSSSSHASSPLSNHAKLPLTETTKQLHFASSILDKQAQNGSNKRSQSSLNSSTNDDDSSTAELSIGSSAERSIDRSLTLNTDGTEDLDSDEELPPPPPELSVDVTHVSASRLSTEFPPPPSPGTNSGSSAPYAVQNGLPSPGNLGRHFSVPNSATNSVSPISRSPHPASIGSPSSRTSFSSASGGTSNGPKPVGVPLVPTLPGLGGSSSGPNHVPYNGTATNGLAGAHGEHNQSVNGAGAFSKHPQHQKQNNYFPSSHHVLPAVYAHLPAGDSGQARVNVNSANYGNNNFSNNNCQADINNANNYNANSMTSSSNSSNGSSSQFDSSSQNNFDPSSPSAGGPGGIFRHKSRPPPPPKRDETTRLSTIPPSPAGVSPRNSSTSTGSYSSAGGLTPGTPPVSYMPPGGVPVLMGNSVPTNGFSHSGSVGTSLKPAPGVALKPLVPVKPGGTGRSTALSPERGVTRGVTGGNVPTMQSGAGEPNFMNDLQRAMLKRQKQLADQGHVEG